jgi:hypothetical protein
MKNIRLLIVGIVLFVTACNGGEPPMPFTYNANPKYTWGYVEYFGPEYATYGIKNNILSVSLFSDSLSIDSTASLKGIGQFLFLEDVYISPTGFFLPLKTYTISNSHEAYTIAPGKNDTVGTEVFPIGACIYYYEENSSKSTVKFITEGSCVVDTINNKYRVVCNFKTADKMTLKGTFLGQLPHVDESMHQFNRLSATHRFLKLQ